MAQPPSHEGAPTYKELRVVTAMRELGSPMVHRFRMPDLTTAEAVYNLIAGAIGSQLAAEAAQSILDRQPDQKPPPLIVEFEHADGRAIFATADLRAASFSRFIGVI